MKKTKLCKHIKRTMALLLSLAMMWHAGSVLCVSASAECIEKNQENGNLEPGEDQEPPALEEEETKENGSLEPGEDQESSDLEEEEIKEDGNLESGEDRENCVSGEDDAKGSVILEEEEDQESQPLENEETTDEGEVSEKEEILFVGDDFETGGNDEQVILGGIDCVVVKDYRSVGKLLRDKNIL